MRSRDCCAPSAPKATWMRLRSVSRLRSAPCCRRRRNRLHRKPARRQPRRRRALAARRSRPDGLDPLVQPGDASRPRRPARRAAPPNECRRAGRPRPAARRAEVPPPSRGSVQPASRGSVQPARGARRGVEEALSAARKASCEARNHFYELFRLDGLGQVDLESRCVRTICVVRARVGGERGRREPL